MTYLKIIFVIVVFILKNIATKNEKNKELRKEVMEELEKAFNEQDKKKRASMLNGIVNDIRMRK